MKKVKFSDVVQIISGGTPKTSVKEYWGGDIGWLSVNDFNNDDRMVYETEKKITLKGLQESNTKLLNRNDLIISARGTVGAISQLGKPLAFNQSTFGLRGKTGIVENDYLYYWLKQYVNNLRAKSQGSVFETINLSTFDYIDFDLLELKDQKEISNMLSRLDKKIELNKKINKELEQMARELYDYWFVQFDFPNAEGKPYKSSNGEMQYSSEINRNIPRGWECKTLYDIANYTNGIASQKFRPKGSKNYKVIKIKEMKDGFTSDSDLVDITVPKKIIVQDGDILFSWSASLEVMIWSGGIGSLNQHIFKVTSDEYPKSFIYMQLLSYLHIFQKIAENRKTTMGHITIDHLKQSKIVIPSQNIINNFANYVDPLVNKIVKNKQQAKVLRELRDEILPMLMSGQIKINK